VGVLVDVFGRVMAIGGQLWFELRDTLLQALVSLPIPYSSAMIHGR
jgi:hypothetical protein